MDDFLYKFRKDPKPEFAKRLYQRINQPMEDKSVSRKLIMSWKPALAGAAVVIVASLAISPSARAMAQDFLNLFRVKNFAAITVDPARMAQIQQDLKQNNVDLKTLMGSQAEVLKNPGKPVTVASPAEAGQKAGITVRTPTNLPPGFTLQQVQVQGEGGVRIKADTAKLQTLLTDLGVTDVRVPPQLNGQTITINTPPVVMLDYGPAAGSAKNLTVLQAHNPQVNLPQGVDLAQLGEIALRVTGMSADEAHRFAQSIDWTSTLLVPVPANASSFRQVQVRGVNGLLITTDSHIVTVPEKGTSGSTVRTIPASSFLIWAEGDMVYAIGGTGNVTLVDLANSLQ
jgi:hypothetical protein